MVDVSNRDVAQPSFNAASFNVRDVYCAALARNAIHYQFNEARAKRAREEARATRRVASRRPATF